jgi:hypothetical protein
MESKLRSIRGAKPGSERHIGTITWEIKTSIGMSAELKRLQTA